MFVCCECCVLSGRSLCDELITRPEKSYRVWRVVCNLETSKNKTRKLKPTIGLENTTTMGCNGRETNRQEPSCEAPNSKLNSLSIELW